MEIPVTPWYQSRTIITALVMLVVTILKLVGVVPPDDKALGAIVDGLLALGAVLVVYLRIEPSSAKPITGAQASVLASDAKRIAGGGQ